MPKRPTYSQLIKQHREDAGESQEALALALRVRPGYVSKIERGESVPSSDLIIQISNHYGLTLIQTNAVLKAAGRAEIQAVPQ